MTHDMRGHYAEKHSGKQAVDPEVAAAIRRHAENGRMSCAQAHRLSKELKIEPGAIGFHLDMTETRLTQCQLGLFGYGPKKKIVQPADEVGEELEHAVKAALEGGKLSCKAAWAVADRLGLKKLDVSAACEKLGIKISPCQLGAFSGGGSSQT
ncbi:MAG: hypothetical protein JRK53_21850 [Deltaproteobacteria bacterium]|nr:hypothetical protein [Deltaproteobacteria bacterium]MBW1818217.1 hypothetical protein [Deltaproteobacteria bacterium]